MNLTPGHGVDHIDHLGTTEIVTLSGSMRFFPEMLIVAAELSLNNAIVLAPFDTHTHPDSPTPPGLAVLHRKRIRLATRRMIVVSDTSGYIGEATRSEITYARAVGLHIEFRSVDRAANS